MIRFLIAILVCLPALAQVQQEAAGPILSMVIDISSLGLDSATLGSLSVSCDSGTGFSGGHVTGDLSPITQRIPFLTDRTTSAVTANFSRLRTNVVCRAGVAGSGSGGGSGTSSWTSGALNFGTIIDFSCVDQTFTASGLVTNTPLLVVPYSGIGSVAVTAWASATNTANVRVCNSSGADVTVSGVFVVREISAGATLTGSGTLNFSNIIAGGTASLTLSITGATTAMGSVVSPPAALEAGILVTSRVTASNTLTVIATNLSDADIDPASGTYSGVLIQ